MFALLRLLVSLISNWLKSRRRLEVENLYLRHQLNIALRGAPHGLRLRGVDRAFLVWMTRPLARPAQPVTRGSAGYDPALASRRISDLLALEVSRSTRPSQD